LQVSEDFGAQVDAADGQLKIHDHFFPGANTAMAWFKDLPDWAMQKQREILEGSVRLDLFGIREGGRIDGGLAAPLDARLPPLVAGREYLLEVVLRTLTLGHLFTEGTADSNEVWVAVDVYDGDRLLGTSGGRDPVSGAVDRDAHFVNTYALDREGRRIDRRNVEDIFTSLYNHQIPPGAADTLHFRLSLPTDVRGPVRIEAKLLYRKFDNHVFGLAQGDADAANPLPVTVIARDTVVLPVQGRAADFLRAAPSNADVPLWMRWNDYGIGLLRKRGAGQLRQAEEAFAEVERLEPGMGALNRSRVYVREGRLEEAVDALSRAAAAGAYPWTVTWFSAQVNLQNGFVDEAIADLERLLDSGFAGAEERGFDFGKDYRARNLLAQALIERSRLERGDARRPAREGFLQRAIDHYNVVLEQDPENVAAHYGLAQAYADLGREAKTATHRALHAKYKPDDNARDRAVALARRRDPAADRAANSVVIYPLKTGPVSTADALPGGAGRGR
jgi:tetratricopeptide (TPR) repeat protein